MIINVPVISKQTVDGGKAMEEDFGQRVRQKRNDEGMSQTELAGKVEISRNYLSQIERGEAVNLSWQVKKKLADTLGIFIEKQLDESAILDDLPPGLREFSEAKGLPETDILMLARLEYRGQQPTTTDQWKVLYNIIKTVISDE